MTVAEAAKRLGRSVWTVYRLIEDGHIRATKIRGTYTVHDGSVSTYIKDRTNNRGKTS